MDMYFLPCSRYDRFAFLSEPIKISKCSSMNEEQNIEMEVGVIMSNMALVYIQQGAMQSALDLLELAKDFISKNNLAESSLMPSILNSLGCIHYRQENFDGALLSFQVAHKSAQIGLQRRNQGRTTENTSLLQCLGTTSSNIGRMNFIQEKYEEATAHCLDALQSRKAAFGQGHIEVYSTLYNLGFIKQQQGSFDEAINFYQVVLDYICTLEHCAIRNQDVVSLLTSALFTYCKRLIFRTKSFDLLDDLKRLQSLRDFDYDDYRASVVLSRIAATLFSFSLHQFALPFLFEQLRIEKILLGDVQSQLATTFDSIGQVYQEQHFHKQAISYFTEAVKLFKSSGDKRMLAATTFNIGMNYYQTDCHDQALSFCEEAVKIQKEFYGEYHPEVADMMYNIGVAQLEVGKLNEALDKFMEALLIRRLVFGNDHSNVVELLYRIAKIHDLKGEEEEALNIFYETVRVQKKDTPRSIAVAITLQNIAQIHHSIGNLEKSVNAIEEVLSILIENVGVNHQVVASLLNVLGNLYIENGKISDSALAHRRSQRIMKKMQSTGGANENEVDLKLLSLFGYNSEAHAPAAAAA